MSGCVSSGVLIILVVVFLLERCSAVWRLGAGGFLVVALVVILVNCIYFHGTFLSLSFRGSGGLPCG